MASDAGARWDAEAAHFDQAADHGLTDPEVRGAWASLLTELLPIQPARVADLGCGTGSLSLLVADLGHRVEGVDVSPNMLKHARTKANGRADVTFREGDAGQPALTQDSYDVVLCRHVLWALEDPAGALAHWTSLLKSSGRLILIEGRWHTGAGLAATDTLAMLADIGRTADLRPLTDPVLWGGPIRDERYAVVSATR